MVTAVSEMYIDMIKAFRSDCQILIREFKEEHNKSLTSFLKIWHSLQFYRVYERQYSKHGREHDFINDSFQIAKLIMLREHFSGGMFLMYGLYCLQDDPIKATFRLELDEFRHILRVLRMKDEDIARSTRHELAFIFAKLVKYDAFDFVLFGREFDLEGQHLSKIIYENQYEFCDVGDDDNNHEEHSRNMGPKDWLRNISKHTPKGMEDLEENYLSLKSKIKSAFPYLNLSLDMVQEDIITTLRKSLTQANSMVELQDAGSTIGARRRSLKNRKRKIKQRYRIDDNDEKMDLDELSSHKEVASGSIPPKKKRGAPKGEKKLFFSQVINHYSLKINRYTESEEEKEEEEEEEEPFFFHEMSLKREDDLPDIM